MNKSAEQVEEGIDWTPVEQSPSETAVIKVKFANDRTDTMWYNKDNDTIFSYDGESEAVTHWKYAESHLHQRKQKTEFDKGFHSRDEEVKKLVEVLRELAIRGNYIFPETEEELIQFEEKFTGNEHELWFNIHQILQRKSPKEALKPYQVTK